MQHSECKPPTADMGTPHCQGLKLLPCDTGILKMQSKIAARLQPSRPHSSKEEEQSEEHDVPFEDRTWKCIPLLFTFHWPELSHMALLAAKKSGKRSLILGSLGSN